LVLDRWPKAFGPESLIGIRPIDLSQIHPWAGGQNVRSCNRIELASPEVLDAGGGAGIVNVGVIHANNPLADVKAISHVLGALPRK
jgi:hypothetical protein